MPNWNKNFDYSVVIVDIWLPNREKNYFMKHMKIRYKKKKEIKTDHFWNLPNINDPISNYAKNVEHFNYQTERKIMSGNMKKWYEKKNEIKTDHLKFTKYWWDNIKLFFCNEIMSCVIQHSIVN